MLNIHINIYMVRKQILKTFFRMITANFEKKHDKSKYSWLVQLFNNFLKLKFSPIWASKQRNDKESKPKFPCLPSTKQRTFLLEKSFLRESRWEGLNKIRKYVGFFKLLSLRRLCKKFSKKHANEFKVHQKTVMTTNKI